MLGRFVAMVGSLVVALATGGTATFAVGAPTTSAPAVESKLVGSDPSCTGSAPIDFTASFASRIRSPQVLRFIAYLDRLPESDQKGVVAAIGALPKTRVMSQAERGCRTVAGIGTMRALYLIANRWNIPLAGPGDATYDALTRAIEAAIVTLLDDTVAEIPARQLARASTLAPFAYAPARPPDSAPTPSHCTLANEDAQTISISKVTYPEFARANRTQGTVDVRVDLSDRGLVESAKIHRTTAGDRIGNSALTESAILSASESTYAPERIACVARAGSYFFRVDFTGR